MQNTQVCEMLPSPIFNLASTVKMTFRYSGGVCGNYWTITANSSCNDTSKGWNFICKVK